MSYLSIPKGTSWAVEWPVTDEAGEPVDVTGWDVAAQVRALPSSASALHEWSTTIDNAQAGDGFIRLLVAHDESAAWTWEEGHYDVMLTSPADERTLIDSGIVRVGQTVTRDVSD